MDQLIPIFVAAILVTTVASVVLGVVSYAAYKVRQRRRPNRDFAKKELAEATFFQRYVPEEASHG